MNIQVSWQHLAMQNQPDQPLVSIVVTTYNGGKYLAAQLDSLVSQSWPQLEIIVADDCSTDNTLAIAADYQQRDPRIIILGGIANMGLHRNLERALRAATGTYIAISDQDDIWQQSKIEKLLGSIDGHIAIFSDSELIDSDGNKLGKTVMQSVKVQDWENCHRPLNLFFKNVVSGHATLFHRNLLDAVLPFRDELIFDHHLAMAASVYGGLAYYPEPLVLHRIHGENHTNRHLADDDEAGSDSGENKLTRRQRYRDRLIMRIELLDDARRRGSKILGNAGFRADDALVDELLLLAHALRNFGNGFFSLPVFLLLIKMGKKHPYCKHFRLKRCFTLAKGDAWYRFASLLGMR